MRAIDDINGLTAAQVTHRHLTSLPAATTIGELRRYFAASTSRRLAVLVDGPRYVGSIEAAAFPGDADDAARAADYAGLQPVVEARAPAERARDVALERPSLRVPVVDDAGALVGVVAITSRLDGFCGT